MKNHFWLINVVGIAAMVLNVVLMAVPLLLNLSLLWIWFIDNYLIFKFFIYSFLSFYIVLKSSFFISFTTVAFIFGIQLYFLMCFIFTITILWIFAILWIFSSFLILFTLLTFTWSRILFTIVPNTTFFIFNFTFGYFTFGYFLCLF